MCVSVREGKKSNKMRSELSDEQPNQSTNRHQNQFVEDIGQSVANALFGYTNVSENQISTNEEEINTIRPKRSAKKVQQVCLCICLFVCSMKDTARFRRIHSFFRLYRTASATIRSGDDRLQFTK